MGPEFVWAHLHLEWCIISRYIYTYHRVYVSVELNLWLFGWIVCSHAQHASLILSLSVMPTRLYQNSPRLRFPFHLPPPLSLYTQECVICGSADRVCNIPAEPRREGQPGERWWKTSLLPPPLTYPLLPPPRSNDHHAPNPLYGLSPPCHQLLVHVSGRKRETGSLFLFFFSYHEQHLQRPRKPLRMCSTAHILSPK